MGFARDIAIGVIAGLICIPIEYVGSLVLNYFGLINLMNVQFPIWITLFLVVTAITIVAMIARTRYFGGGASVFIHRSRPDHIVAEFSYPQFGVNWKVLYGSHVSDFLHPYAWAESNPYCPKCNYEMKEQLRGSIFKRSYWKCDRCGKFYKVPMRDSYDAHEVVERLLESDINTGRIKLAE